MKKLVFVILIFVAINSSFAISEDDYFRVMGEVYFRFQNPQSIEKINQISRIVSVSKVTPYWVYAYANEKEFKRFVSLGIPYDLLQHPGFLAANDFATKFSLKLINPQYPSYQDYISLMNHFQSQYPEICQVFEIGTSVLGRKILCAKISGITDTFCKPKVFLTSTIHGNEPAGYVMMLYLIDYILTNYGFDPKITNIVDRTEIWINPLANPDGTYWSGDETVFGARRYNANGVDLNRNFPDPQEGQHPDGNQFQPETIAMMEFAEKIGFVLSANFHSGAEVVNYPWDTWERAHPDNDWFVFISRDYADTVHLNSPADYFDDLNNGITNGYAWYRITGGRQDYMNYFQHCREITIEISDEYLPENPFLYWLYNRQAIIELISQSLTGICGTVFCQNGTALTAKIEIPDRDFDNSFVFSNEQNGRFFRLLLQGVYNLSITAKYHYSQQLQNIQVIDGELTAVYISLEHAAKGDPTADRITDISDVIVCLRMAIGLDLMDFHSCDINNDGNIDISDVILILRMSIGL